MPRQIDLHLGVQPVVNAWTRLVNDRAAAADLSTAASSSTSGVFGDPGTNGVYFGIDIGANNTPPSSPGVGGGYPARESYYGHRMGCLRSYFDWGSMAALVTRAQNDIAQGRVPLLSLKVDALGGSNSGWDLFAAGAGDAQFVNLLNNLAAIGQGPILLCLHHEPNNGDPGTSAMYLAMYRHAMALMGTSYPRILLVGGMLADSFFFSDQASPALNIASWIQPDSCHIPGLDFYHPDDSPGNASWRSFATSFNTSINQLSAIYGGLSNMPPLVVGEWGCHTWSLDVTQTTSYMQDFYDWMLVHGYAMAYFDAVGSLWTTLDLQGKINAAATFDGENGPPWVRLDKFGDLLSRSTSKFIPFGGLT